MNAAATTTQGLSLEEIYHRNPDHDPRRLRLALEDELRCGRVSRTRDGRYSIVPSAFDPEVWDALRALETPRLP